MSRFSRCFLVFSLALLYSASRARRRPFRLSYATMSYIFFLLLGNILGNSRLISYNEAFVLFVCYTLSCLVICLSPVDTSQFAVCVLCYRVCVCHVCHVCMRESLVCVCAHTRSCGLYIYIFFLFVVYNIIERLDDEVVVVAAVGSSLAGRWHLDMSIVFLLFLLLLLRLL